MPGNGNGGGNGRLHIRLLIVDKGTGKQTAVGLDKDEKLENFIPHLATVQELRAITKRGIAIGPNDTVYVMAHRAGRALHDFQHYSS